MSDQEKLQSDYYLLVPKWRHLTQFWAIILCVLSAVYYVIVKDGLTFDSQEQKNRVINGVFNTDDQAVLKNLILDQNRHMTVEEKNALLLLQDRQKAIKDDVAEIKSIVKRLEKNSQ